MKWRSSAEAAAQALGQAALSDWAQRSFPVLSSEVYKERCSSLLPRGCFNGDHR